MQDITTDLLLALLPAVMAGLGGGFAVFAGYDDAPGGVLLGLLLILGSAVVNYRSRKRARGSAVPNSQ